MNKVKQGANRGFTIVELLIVIVVIGILAAITIVAYTGITTQANAKTALGNAQSVQSVANTYNGDQGSYPTVAQLNAYNGYAKVPSGVTVQGTSISAGSNTVVLYVQKPATGTPTGACILAVPANTTPTPSMTASVTIGDATGTMTLVTTAPACS